MFYFTQGNITVLWTKNQLLLSILAIAQLGGFLLAFFVYHWLVGWEIGLKVGAAHGAIAGFIWAIFYTSFERENSSYV